MEALTTFRELGVVPEIADALETEGIVEAFPIQSLALPIALSGHDIIGQARTGTGKTFAFGIPLLQRIPHGGKAPLGLIVVPTRELAIQVTDDLTLAGGKLGSRVLSVYGGRAYEPQIEALQRGVDVVVGTPGRMLDLVKQKHLDLSQVQVLVLDEADRMLDLGFLPDIERIIGLVPASRQTMLFSATMPGEIMALSRRYLSRPTNVRAEAHAESEATPQVKQYVWQAHQMDKPEVLTRILQANGRGLTMVFCQTKRACDRVAEDLSKRGFAVAAVHGDLGQSQRERALRAFRGGKIDVLIATDVAARGLDVDDVTHVVNYECPEDEKAYVHRIGRTGRAGREGIAVTLVDWQDVQRWKLINTALGLDFPALPEIYSSSPELYEALDIPADAKGILPTSRRERAGLAAEELEDIGETGRTRSGGGGGSARRGPKDRDDDLDERRPRRTRNRRRTRSGRTPESEEAVSTEAVSADTPATEPALDPAAEVKPRRTRTRKAAEPVETAETAEVVAAEVELDPVAEVKPARTRRTKAAETAETAETEAAEALEPAADVKPARTRRAKAVAAETVDEVAAEAAEAVKPVRTRRTKAAAAEAADLEPAAEAKPARTRRTKAAETAEVAEPAADVKPVRTRRTRAAADEAAAEIEPTAEVKPARARRTRAADEAVAEPEVQPARISRTTAAEAPEPAAAIATAAQARIAPVMTAAGIPSVIFADGGLPAVETDDLPGGGRPQQQRKRRRY